MSAAPDARPAPSVGPTPRSQAMTVALQALLNRVSGAREALPLLAALEQTLEQGGIPAVEKVANGPLSRIAAQLASLPIADDDQALQDLQSLLMAIIERRARAVQPRGRYLSTFISDDKLEVSEVSHSDFLAAAQGLKPADRG